MNTHTPAITTSTATAAPAETTRQRWQRRLYTAIENSGNRLNGFLLLPFLLPFPVPNVPNPFCIAFQIGLTWIGSLVGLAVLVFGAQIVGRHFLGRAGGDLTQGALAIVAGLFVLGLLSNDGAGLVLVAQSLGFEGFTLSCSATAGF